VDLLLSTGTGIEVVHQLFQYFNIPSFSTDEQSDLSSSFKLRDKKLWLNY